MNPIFEKYRKNLSAFRDKLTDLSPEDAAWCTDIVLRRYLIARSGNVSKAEQQLRETLKWRKEYQVISAIIKLLTEFSHKTLILRELNHLS